ncbi:MAG: DNA polymerase III subunit delta [Planctomyces sp.]
MLWKPGKDAVVHATEFLSSKQPVPGAPVIVLVGEERFLKVEVLQRLPGCSGEDGDLSLSRLPGKTCEIRDVMAELRTVSMFSDQRVLLIEDADDFVSENRQHLEKYVENPSRASVLILDVRSFPKTTRLFKAVNSTGLIIECSELKGAALVKWIRKYAQDEFGKVLDQEAASLIVHLAGDSLGLLQQEVNKVAALVGDNETITTDDVTRVVGGWRLETTWEMLNAIRDNQPGRAIETLNQLIGSGEAPQKLLGATTYVFRKMAEATELARQKVPVSEALQQAKIRPMDVQPSEKYLKRMGYQRASQILQWLVEVDHGIKGGGSHVDARILMERLFLRLSGM